MRTTIEKFEKAEKRLKTALVFCLFMGAFLLGFALLIYLKHFLSRDWDKPVPVAVFQYFIAGTRAVVYMLLPAAGAGYLLVGYRIWYYRRQRNALKEYDKTDV